MSYFKFFYIFQFPWEIEWNKLEHSLQWSFFQISVIKRIRWTFLRYIFFPPFVRLWSDNGFSYEMKKCKVLKINISMLKKSIIWLGYNSLKSSCGCADLPPFLIWVHSLLKRSPLNLVILYKFVCSMTVHVLLDFASRLRLFQFDISFFSNLDLRKSKRTWNIV